MSIYNHYVENSFAAYFDTPLPDVFFERLLDMAKGYPALVAKDEMNNVAGFAFLHAYHPAPAFLRTAEITYFIHPEHIRRGFGKLLLDRLIDGARKMGVDSIVASISSLNEGSLRFHAKHGFKECGRLIKAGEKKGNDFDVVYMQMFLSS